jgi:hypothetical protein
LVAAFFIAAVGVVRVLVWLARNPIRQLPPKCNKNLALRLAEVVALDLKTKRNSVSYVKQLPVGLYAL